MELLHEGIEFPGSKALVWKGHESAGFDCAWNSMTDQLASASKDATTRIWDVSNNSAVPKPITLNHLFSKKETPSDRAVTSVDWNWTGTLLVSGSVDGFARIWTTFGRQIRIFGHESKTIFLAKWNKRSNYILTAGADITTTIWEAETGKCMQEFTFHSAPISSIDWLDNITFASGSLDKTIYVCKLKYNAPIKQFYGHTGEVNSIKWDPEGKLLASCSDDTTLKIWSMTEDVVVNLTGHSNGVYRMAWSPTGPCTPNPNKNRILASVSLDSTVRIWDIEQNTCFHTLSKHTDDICSVEFSPDGKFLAAASSKTLQIWSTQNWELVYSYVGEGRFYQIAWNSRGHKLAATADNGNVFVLDINMLATESADPRPSTSFCIAN